MMMNLDALKNDTARKNAIRDRIADIMVKAMIAEFGEENVVYIPKAIYIGKDGGTKISGDSLAVKVGEVTNKDGFLVDAVVICGCTVKGWNDVAKKNGTVTLAVNMDDILDAVNGENGQKQPFSFLL